MSKQTGQTTPRSITSRSLTDAEIVQQAIFPALQRDRVSNADHAFGLVINYLCERESVPVSLVLWPTGVRSVITIAPGDRSPDASRLLVRVYRAAAARRLGPISEVFDD